MLEIASPSHIRLGNILHRNGETAESLNMLRYAQKMQPLVTRFARREKAEFSVLLHAPGTGCTPIDHLIHLAPYDCHFYCLLPGNLAHHLDLLQDKADAVINLIADADYGKESLPLAQNLVHILTAL